MNQTFYTEYAMFQVPLVILNVNNWDTKKKQLLNLYEKYSANDYVDSDGGGYEVQTNFHYLKDNKEESKKFCNEISILLKEEFSFFKSRIKNNNIYLSTSWYQLYKKNQQHPIHNHGALGYSFVCFIEFDSEYHRPTTFISPFNNFENGTAVYHTPNVKEGNIIFFPSVILHESTKNLSEKERVILSGNFKFTYQDDE